MINPKVQSAKAKAVALCTFVVPLFRAILPSTIYSNKAVTLTVNQLFCSGYCPIINVRHIADPRSTVSMMWGANLLNL
jgi:hypothetical protein